MIAIVWNTSEFFLFCSFNAKNQVHFCLLSFNRLSVYMYIKMYVALICGLLRSAALVNDDAMARDGVIIKVHTSNQLTKVRRERAPL